MTWQAADGNGAPVTGYTLIPSPSCPGCGGLTASGGATSSTVVGLHPGDAYFFTVVATNSVGDSDPSGPSDLVTPPPEAPGPPTNVRATAGDGRATVTWDQSDPNGSSVTLYTVTASPGGAMGTSPGGGATSVEGLANGTAYTFTVVATNAIGDSPPSAPSNTITASGLPGPPTSVQAVMGDREATVTWGPADGNGGPIVGYTVTAYPEGQSIRPSTSVDGSSSSATVTGLDNATRYFFSVAATNVVGTGPSADSPLLDSVRQVADRYMTGSLDDFLAVRDQAPRPYNWSTDTCAGEFPDAFMADPCLRHDFGYRNYGNGIRLQRNEATRNWIDDIFLQDMLAQCQRPEFILAFPECVSKPSWDLLRGSPQRWRGLEPVISRRVHDDGYFTAPSNFALCTSNADR